MTNAELNLAIARLRYPEHAERWFIRGNTGVWNAVEGKGFNVFDWNDLMPLVVELGVTYVLTTGNKKPFWVATHRRYGNVEAEDLSEQALKVALAKCALKVLEAKQ